MARRQPVDPYSMTGGGGEAAPTGRPTLRQLKTGIKVYLKTDNHPNGVYYPVVYRSDSERPQRTTRPPLALIQRQWVGGMGQRVMRDPDKFMVSSAHTLRQNEFMPQPFAQGVNTTNIGGRTVGEFQGVSKRFLEWDGSANPGVTPTARRLYMVTYQTEPTVVTRIYMLKFANATPPKWGWWLWKEFTNWLYLDATIINNEIHILGSHVTGGTDSHYWYATRNTEVGDTDWSAGGLGGQGGQERHHDVVCPDGVYYSRGPVLYRPNNTSITVGSTDLSNTINGLTLYNNVLVIIKPDGLYSYTQQSQRAELVANLRTYFHTDTGYQIAQWGQSLFFNLGKLLAAFDGQRLVIEPPVWDWADPQWQPAVNSLANCGEALGVAFDGRAAAFDGQDWHNIYRTGGVMTIAWTMAYTDRGPLCVFCTYPDGTGYGDTFILEYSPSFFKPLYAETKANERSWLVSSLMESQKDESWYFSDMRVQTRNLSPTFGLRAYIRTQFADGPTSGFVALYPTAGIFGVLGETEKECLFSLPPSVNHGNALQYKLEFIPNVPSMHVATLPAVSSVRITTIPRPLTDLRAWAYQIVCMNEYEFPDGSAAQYDASSLMQILWEAHYQLAPVTLGIYQPATAFQRACWLEYKVYVDLEQQDFLVDENETQCYLVSVRFQEVTA